MESLKEKIYRNAFIISALVSLVFGAVKLVNVLKNAELPRYLLSVSFEAVVFLSCAVCLIAGTKKSAPFFEKAFGSVCKIVLAYFSVIMPFVHYLNNINRTFLETELYKSAFCIFCTASVYMICSFRRHGIYFNASFSESESYKKCVLQRIGKAGIYVAVCLIVSVSLAFLTIPLALMKWYVYKTIYIYVSSYVLTSLLYFLYSVLEKESSSLYIGLSRKTVMALTAVALASALNKIFTFVRPYVFNGMIRDLLARQIFEYVDIFITVALVIYMIYFVYEYRKINENRLLAIGCYVFAFAKIANIVICELMATVRYISMPKIVETPDGYEMLILTTWAEFLISLICYAVAILGLSLVIISLIKYKMISPLNVISVVVWVLLFVCSICLDGVLHPNMLAHLKSACELLTLVYFVFVSKEVTAKTPMPLAMNDF